MPLALHFSLPLLVLITGVVCGDITGWAIPATLLFALWVAGQERLPEPLWLIGVFIVSLAFAAHLIPGFIPRTLAPEQHLGSSIPWTLRLNWDKALVAALLLAHWLGEPRQPWRSPRGVLIASLACLTLTPAVALVTGVLGWSPKWPAYLFAWLLVNLFVTSLAEELLFRAYLQTALIRRVGVHLGIVLTALLFGAVHLPFSPGIALIAALAGLAYGAAFNSSGNRLWVPVLLHTGLNSLHLLLLTYPLP